MRQFQLQAASSLQGSIQVPGDKSISHRCIMLAAIAEGVSVIDGFLFAADTLATLKALQALGIVIVVDDTIHRVTVYGQGFRGMREALLPLDLQNSGTGMRLLMGLLAGQNFNTTLLGDVSLSQRPLRRI